MAGNNETNISAIEAQASNPEASPAAIDIEKLTDRVYRLMQAEVRLERARGSTADWFGSE